MGLAYEDADDNLKSQRRTLIGGKAHRTCALDPGPATGVLIELVDRRTQEVLATTETDHNGHFVLGSAYLEDPDRRLYVRFGGLEADLPGTADRNYWASLPIPCSASPESSTCRRADYALAGASEVPSGALERLLGDILRACPGHKEAAARLAVIEAQRSPAAAPAAGAQPTPAATASAAISAEQITSTLNTPTHADRPPVVELEVLFAFDSDRLDPVSHPQIAAVAAALQHPSLGGRRFIIGGYTDSIGEEAYNLGLSQRRAESVRRQLVEQHLIAADRLIAVGYGERSPGASNESAAERARNRRVTLVEAAQPAPR